MKVTQAEAAMCVHIKVPNRIHCFCFVCIHCFCFVLFCFVMLCYVMFCLTSIVLHTRRNPFGRTGGQLPPKVKMALLAVFGVSALIVGALFAFDVIKC